MGKNVKNQIFIDIWNQTRGEVALRDFPSMRWIRNWSNRQPIKFTHWPSLSKSISMEVLLKKSSRMLQRLISLNIDIITTLSDHFACSVHQHSNLRATVKLLFHVKDLQKDVTVNSELDKRIQNCCFTKVDLSYQGNWILGKFNTNKIFARFGQSGLQVRCKREISCFLEKTVSFK